MKEKCSLLLVNTSVYCVKCTLSNSWDPTTHIFESVMAPHFPNLWNKEDTQLDLKMPSDRSMDAFSNMESFFHALPIQAHEQGALR